MCIIRKLYKKEQRQDLSFLWLDWTTKGIEGKSKTTSSRNSNNEMVMRRCGSWQISEVNSEMLLFWCICICVVSCVPAVNYYVKSEPPWFDVFPHGGRFVLPVKVTVSLTPLTAPLYCRYPAIILNLTLLGFRSLQSRHRDRYFLFGFSFSYYVSIHYTV